MKNTLSVGRDVRRVSAALFVFSLLLLASCDGVAGPEDDLSDSAAMNRADAPADDLSWNGDPSGCKTGTQSSGATFEICFPDILKLQLLPWNGHLIVYAHGYQNPEEGPKLPGEAAELCALVLSQGFACASTSYSKSGLAIREGVADVTDLAKNFTRYVDQAFGKRVSAPDVTVLSGASEGGAVTVLAVEAYPDSRRVKKNQRVFDGGLTACGPIGSFADQMAYFGDFIVVFNYYFDLLDDLVTPVYVDPAARVGWGTEPPTGYAYDIQQLLLNNPDKAAQLRDVTGLPVRDGSTVAVVESALQVLYYNIFATEDAVATLGGSGYDNTDRVYSGSNDDAALNAGVARYRADRRAVREIADHYETTGKLVVPMEAITTTLDPQVPAWQQARYGQKVAGQGLQARLLYNDSEISRYGHCAFEQDELLDAFNRLLLRITGQQLFTAETPATDKATFDVSVDL